MNITVDRQSILGLLSATGLPPIFHAVITFFHPSIYTLTCGKSYIDGVASCYEADRAEAVLWIALTVVAVAYGGYTFWVRTQWNPSPPAGSKAAIIPAGEIPVTIDQSGAAGLQTAKANPGTVQDPLPIVVPQPPTNTSGVSP